MSLAYTSSMTVSISNNLIWATTNPADDTVLIFDNPSTPLLRVYSLATAAFVKSITLTGFNNYQAQGFTVVSNGASAVLFAQNDSRPLIIELASSAFCVAVTGSVSSVSKGQSFRNNMAAYDPVNGIVLCCSNFQRTLKKLDLAGNYTSTDLTITTSSVRTSLDSVSFESIIFIGNGRFIIANSFAQFFEIDSSGNVYKQLKLNLRSPNFENFQTTTFIPCFMKYDNGMLLIINQNGNMGHLVDWTTGTILQSHLMTRTTVVPSFESLDGVFLVGQNSSTSSTKNLIKEFDYAVEPLNILDVLHSSTEAHYGVGINTYNNKWWYIQQTSGYKLHYGTITARASTTRTISTPTNLPGEILLLDDTTRPAKVILSTYSTFPRVVRVPTGITIREIVTEGEGADAIYYFSKYTT